MLGLLLTILVGFIVGVIAKLIMPGKENMGFIITTLLGIAGSIVASYAGDRPADGLEANTHYWPIDLRNEEINPDEGQMAADRALAWYRQHDLLTHARVFRECVGVNTISAHVARQSRVDRQEALGDSPE